MRFTFNDFQLIPYTRMTARGKWIVPKAKRYLENQKVLSWGFKFQMRENDWEMLPAKKPLWVKWMVVRRGSLYTCDLDNLLKAILDGAQGIVYEDDRYITHDLGGEKRIGSTGLVVVEFGLVSELGGEFSPEPRWEDLEPRRVLIAESRADLTPR